MEPAEALEVDDSDDRDEDGLNCRSVRDDW